MALAISEAVAHIDSSTDTDTYAFGSFTPAANCKLVVVVQPFGTNSDAVTLSDSGMGLTWTKRLKRSWGSGTPHEIYLFEADVGASPAATVITISCGADSATGCGATCFQITGTSVTFVQVIGNSATSTTSPTVTFASALDTNNCYVAGVATASNPAGLDAHATWTSVTDAGHPSSEGHAALYRVNGETGTTITFTGANANVWGMVAAEYAEGAGGATGHGMLVGDALLSKALIGGGLVQ